MTSSGWALVYGIAFVGGVAVGAGLVEIYWLLRREREQAARVVLNNGRLYHD